MQALKGIVIRCHADTVKIELEHGTIITVKGNPKFKFGSRVLVQYDFTRMQVRNVILENEWFPGDEATPPVEELESDGVTDPSLLEYYAEMAEEA